MCCLLPGPLMAGIMQIVLFEPEIPPNTGNIARLCAATGTALHLVEPLGFRLDNRYLKRAGLDYWPNVNLNVWPDWEAFAERGLGGGRLVCTTARDGSAAVPLQRFAFTRHDCLVFGPETRGLGPDILARSSHCVRIPMRAGKVRSLNLSTAAGIVLYAALTGCGLLDDPGWE